MKLTKEQELYILEHAVANSDMESSFLLDCKNNQNLLNKFICKIKKVRNTGNTEEFKFDLGNLYGIFPYLVNYDNQTVEFSFDHFSAPIEFKNFEIKLHFDKIYIPYKRYMTEEELKNRSFKQRLFGIVKTESTHQTVGRVKMYTVDKS